MNPVHQRWHLRAHKFKCAPKSKYVNSTPHHRAVFSFSLLCLGVLAACGGMYGSGMGGASGMCGGMYGGSCAPAAAVTNAPGAVSGTVTLTATASAQGTYSVANVQFQVDGTAVGTAITAAPYSYAWNSITVSDGVHRITAVVTDSANQTATSAAVNLTVSNGSIVVTLSADQLFPQPHTAATGSGNFSVDKSSGAVGGGVTLSGVMPLSVELGDAYAGAESAALIELASNASNPDRWDVPAGITLDTQQRADLAAGKLYVLVRSALNPDGELRGQLLPGGIVVKFAALAGSTEIPPSGSTATGLVAVTVDAANLHAAANINVAGITATGAEIATGAAGTVGTPLATLAVDASDPSHFLNDTISLTSADVTNFTNGLWYGNVSSAAHPAGELRGQIGTIAAAAPTLTQVQADIFTPICSVCHTGIGASLPGSQNLSAGHSYASLVNVSSLEVPSLKRIAPGDPDNSYLVLKIQGSPGIVGVQMPASGGPLSDAQIAEVRAWIAAGALNN
jgi:mono/diheme cytochrome c family protein